MTDKERAFVLAHELLHLALQSSSRCGSTDHEQFNLAHDLIINDILETELDMQPPGGGVRCAGARHRSVETILARGNLPPGGRGFEPPETAMAAALRSAIGQDAVRRHSDMLDEALEREWFPDDSAADRVAATSTTARLAARAVSMHVVMSQTADLAGRHAHLTRATDTFWFDDYIEALHTAYRPPWELALHRWIDGATRQRRSYTRASRRGADRTDVTLPGRIRDSHILSIVLDTSGSMTDNIAHTLTAIRNFGHGANVGDVRIVQCDTAVTVDEMVDIDALSHYRVVGFGGSDMSPALHHLAHDPDTTAVIVITDGAIDYPPDPLPYDVLWAVYPDNFDDDPFTPPYGTVLHTDR